MSRLTPSLLALDKGLDLQTAKIVAPEGSVYDTLNYEQVDFQGQKRIDGYARYDGSLLPALDEYRALTVDGFSVEALPGDLLFYQDKLVGVVGNVEDNVIRYAVIDETIALSPNDDIVIRSYNMADEWSYIVISDVEGKDEGVSIDEHYYYLLNVTASLRAKIEYLPEAIAGLHWFKDRLYAVAGLQMYTSYPVISGNIPNGFVGATGSGTYTIIGGTPPYDPVIVESGSLPPGTTLFPDGTFTYTYTQNGTYSWTVSVTDSNDESSSVPDTAIVEDPDTWFGSTAGGSAPLVRGKYKFGAWQTLPAISLFSPGYMYVTSGVIHAGTQGSYRYSVDGGLNWLAPANNAGVSAGGGRLAFKDGFAFQCGGTNTIKRRVLPSGDWTNPTASTLSRANSVVVVDNTIIVASIYNNGASRSNDNGVTWAVGASYQTSIVGSPLLATNGSRLVVFYNTAPAGGNLLNLKYSDDKGVTWSSAVYTFPNPLQTNIPADLVFDGAYFIAVSTTGQVARSIDGITWQLATGASLPNLLQMAVGQQMTMAACGTSGFYYTQDHGATWITRALPPGTTAANTIAWIPQEG